MEGEGGIRQRGRGLGVSEDAPQAHRSGYDCIPLPRMQSLALRTKKVVGGVINEGVETKVLTHQKYHTFKTLSSYENYNRRIRSGAQDGH